MKRSAEWSGLVGRIDRQLLAEHTIAATQEPHLLVCGPTGFVETTAAALIDLGHDAGRVKTERFGATGGPS